MTSSDPDLVRQAMVPAVGAENVSDDVAGYSIDGLRPKFDVFPSSIQQLSQVMAEASEGTMAVAPWGGGTRVELGNALSRLDVVIYLSRLNRVVQHNHADLTATVEAGIAVAGFQKILAERGQFLALDPPLPDRATIGGTLAAGVSGPLKWQYGNPRDSVIGMKVVQADGKVTSSGGQVVKNVSGYDMSRLHIGGLGTLGIVAEVSFKLTPLPRHQATLVAAFETSQQCNDAGLSIFHSHVTPLALSSFDSVVNERATLAGMSGSHFLGVRLGGRPLTQERQVKECASLCRQHGATAVETLDEANAGPFWRKVADFGWDESTAPTMAGRVSLLPTKVLEVTRALEQSVAGGGVQPAIVSDPGYGNVMVNWFADGDKVSNDMAADVLGAARDAVHRAGGRMIIERCPLDVKSRFDVWDDLSESLAIMRRMKEQYDPRGIINPGRAVGGI